MVVGDKIKLVKPFGTLTEVGEVCEVANILSTGEIYFRHNKGVGIMSYEKFEEYFELVPVENKVEKKKHWIPWEDRVSEFYNPVEDDFVDVDLEWRTDHEKRVQVRVKNEPQLRSRSNCYKDDEFCAHDGFLLAKYRLYPKWVSKVIEDYAKSL